MDRNQIKKYIESGEELARSIQGLSEADLRQRPAPDAGPEIGKWSIQELVIHLSDAEAALADRIRRVIAEDDPVLQAWDETKFAQRLFYDQQSARDAAEMVALTRRQLGRVLTELPDEVFRRTGRHTERGSQTLEQLVAMADGHLHHHLKFLRAKREHFGKLMW